jgi:hypothetical protein
MNSHDDFSDFLLFHSKVKKIKSLEEKKLSGVICKDYVANFRASYLSENEVYNAWVRKAITNVMYHIKGDSIKEYSYEMYGTCIGYLKKDFEQYYSESEKAWEAVSAVLQSAVYNNLHNDLPFNREIINHLINMPNLFYINKKNEFVHYIDKKTGSNVLSLLCLDEKSTFSLEDRYQIFVKILGLKSIKDNSKILEKMITHKRFGYNETHLSAACTSGNFKIVQHIIKIVKELYKDNPEAIKKFISFPTNNGMTAIHKIGINGNIKIYNYLIKEVAAELYKNDHVGFIQLLTSADERNKTPLNYIQQKSDMSYLAFSLQNLVSELSSKLSLQVLPSLGKENREPILSESKHSEKEQKKIARSNNKRKYLTTSLNLFANKEGASPLAYKKKMIEKINPLSQP